MKQGEQEAKEILEKFGVKFDSTYQDDNKGKSMPDLKYIDGGYLEVTHTKHNNAIFKSIVDSQKGSFSDQLEILHKTSDAWERINKIDYQMNNRILTENGQKQLGKDLNLLKKQFGYSPNICGNIFSEFRCNMPIIEFSSNKILDEIVKDKGSKYSNGDTDLFLFVSEDEFEIFFSEMNQYEWNAVAQYCIRMILKAPFPIIYICVWDIFEQKYEIQDPIICKLEKNKDGGVYVTGLRK